MTEQIRVVVIDDHPVVRSGLKAVLLTNSGFEHVGEGSTGEEAVDLAERLLPDVMIMDINMPMMDGLEATRRVVAACPSVAVLVLTMHDDDDTVFAAMRAGARGYLLKGSEQEEVTRAISCVAGGDAIFGPAIADRVLSYFSGHEREQQPFPELTSRERDVLALLADGLSNQSISRQLGVSQKTAANHVSNILNKLQAADRAEAIVRARRAGFGD
ncbi:MAG: response regulator transcription factor [Dehalococcoidia bacterium]